ncbi:NAD(P)/FAD-dependent oxidoreductase [Halobaculum sp. MBLA0143]|uniref:dihydrolipoyl dehydrogenase family protein n=1 Tax=Halobaculum sp. MBLA0143 TaxID=3079933 RepID=UPI0035234D0D
MHVAVIGAYGSAGVAVAERLADHTGPGEVVDRLTMVDDGNPGGGLCILRGCMPSKEVLSAAQHRFQTRHDDRLDGEPPEIDLERVVDRKNEHTADFAAHRRAATDRLAEREGVVFRHDTARFRGPRELELVESGDRIEPDYVVVATGSTVNVPDLPGIDDVPYWTSADVLDATTLPDSGVVMGFGYVGIEMVPYLAEAGVDVTVIEHDTRPLDDAPPGFGDELLSIYREAFDVDIVTETHERRVEGADGGVRLHTDHDGAYGTVEADALFCFTGRRPNVDGLGLDATAVEPEPGWVDATMRATADDSGRTYVVGDANGRDPVLHVAKEQGHVAAENIVADDAGESLTEYDPTPHYVMFAAAATYPYVRVGHTAQTAREAGHETVVVQRRAEDDGVFETKDAPRGLARLIVDRADGTVLGYHGLHYHADVMAKTAQLLVERGADVRTVPDRAYHPTTPEIMDGLFRAASKEL